MGNNLSANISVKQDIAYTEPETKEQILDIYRPATGQDFPCVIWLHGGGLSEGDKSAPEEIEACSALAAAGFLVASVNYRLSGVAPFPASIKDAAEAVAWLDDNASFYGGNRDILFICGYSAGAFLAALLATDPKYLDEMGIDSAALAGVVVLSGQLSTHFTIRERQYGAQAALLVDEQAPLYHASQHTPPFLAMWGEQDLPLRREENRLMEALLKLRGHDTGEFYEYLGRDHSTICSGVQKSDDPVRLKMVEFLRKWSEVD